MFELGPLEVRWYGLFFAIGIALNYLILTWIFKREKYEIKELDSLVVWLFLGLLFGARLGEILFYELGYYIENPGQIVAVWNGGLSSHGAAIGLFIAYFLWCKFHKIKFSHYVDALVIPMGLTAAFVRLGNFFNSEIVGVPSGGNWGVVFQRLGEDFSRHPVQLYEGLLSFSVFILLIFLYRKYYRKWKKLSFVAIYIGLYFGGRFVLEFWKDLHGPLPEGFPLTMGQILSLVPLAIALILMYRNFLKKRCN